MHINPVNVTVCCGIFFSLLFLVCTCAGSARLGYYTQPALLTSLWELCNLSLFLSVSLSGRFWPVAHAARDRFLDRSFFSPSLSLVCVLRNLMSYFSSPRCDLQCPHSHLSTISSSFFLFSSGEPEILALTVPLIFFSSPRISLKSKQAVLFCFFFSGWRLYNYRLYTTPSNKLKTNKKQINIMTL